MFLGRTSLSRLINCISKSNVLPSIRQSFKSLSTMVATVNEDLSSPRSSSNSIKERVPIHELVKDGEQAFIEFEKNMNSHSSSSSKSKEDGQGELEYESVLERILDARLFEKAFNVINALRMAKIKPSEKAYHMAIASGYKTLRITELRELFGKRLSFQGTAKTDDASCTPFFEKLSQLKEWMLQDGHKFTMEFYDQLAFYICGMNFGGLMINIATTLEEQGTEPSIHFYNEMLLCLPKSGFTSRADAIFDRLVAIGRANERTYLNRLSSSVNASNAEFLFNTFIKKYPNASIKAYNTYIKTLINLDQMEKAIQILEEMKNSADSQVKPNEYSINILLAYMIRTGELKSFDRVIEYSKNIDFPKSSLDYCMLLRIYARTNLPKALQIALQIPKPYDVNIYTTALNIFSDPALASELKTEIYHVMFLHNASTDEEIHQKIQPGTLAELFSDFSPALRTSIIHMEKDLPFLSPQIYETLMRAAIRRRAYPIVENLMNRMTREKVSSYSNHCNYHLSALLLQDKIELAKEYLLRMKARKFNLSTRNRTLLQERGISFESSPPFNNNNNMRSPYFSSSLSRNNIKHQEDEFSSDHRDNESQDERY